MKLWPFSLTRRRYQVAPKEERYAVQETTEDVQLGTDAKTTEKVLRLHKFSRAPGGKKVTSRVVATFF